MNWVRLLGGMVTIRVRGAELERFLNACMRDGILLRHICRKEIDELTAELSIREFYRLRGTLHRTHCHVHVLKRSGVPFFLRSLRGRYALWTSALLLIGVIYVLSTRVWVIEANFPDGVDEYMIMRELESMGIRAGTPIRQVDRQAVKLHMMEKFDFLSFFSINFDGNRMQIEVGAADIRLEQPDADTITSVVAVKSGLIERMDIWKGESLVKIGDVVLAGDRLVDAVVQPTAELGKPRLVPASADIWARTWQKGQRILSTRYQQKHYTGKVRTRYALIIGKTRINLYSDSSISMDSCDKIEKITPFRLSDTVQLPAALVTQTLTFYTEEEGVYSETEAQQLLEYGVSRALQYGMTEGSVERLETAMEYQEHAAVLQWNAECLEQIGEAVSDGRTQAELDAQTAEQNQNAEQEGN